MDNKNLDKLRGTRRGPFEMSQYSNPGRLGSKELIGFIFDAANRLNRSIRLETEHLNCIMHLSSLLNNGKLKGYEWEAVEALRAVWKIGFAFAYNKQPETIESPVVELARTTLLRVVDGDGCGRLESIHNLILSASHDTSHAKKEKLLRVLDSMEWHIDSDHLNKREKEYAFRNLSRNMHVEKDEDILCRLISVISKLGTTEAKEGLERFGKREGHSKVVCGALSLALNGMELPGKKNGLGARTGPGALNPTGKPVLMRLKKR